MVTIRRGDLTARRLVTHRQRAGVSVTLIVIQFGDGTENYREQLHNHLDVLMLTCHLTQPYQNSQRAERAVKARLFVQNCTLFGIGRSDQSYVTFDTRLCFTASIASYPRA